MIELASPTAFLATALNIPADKGNEKGDCVLCGSHTNEGLTLNEGFPPLQGTGFTDWNKAVIKDANGIVCGYCTLSNANHPEKMVKMHKSRIRRCLITQSGKVMMLGTNKRLKWMLSNMPDEPFLMMDSRRLASKFVHHVWHSKVSLDKRAFYYCDDKGSHFVRLDKIINKESPNKTLKEHQLSIIIHNEKVEAEKPLHPKHKSYDK